MTRDQMGLLAYGQDIDQLRPGPDTDSATLDLGLECHWHTVAV